MEICGVVGAKFGNGNKLEKNRRKRAAKWGENGPNSGFRGGGSLGPGVPRLTCLRSIDKAELEMEKEQSRKEE